MTKIRLYIQVGDNEPHCIGEGDIDVPTTTKPEAFRAVSELLHEAGNFVAKEGDDELD